MEQPKNFKEGTKSAKHQFTKKAEAPAATAPGSAPELFDLTLPSGLKMQVKPLPELFLLYYGELPRALTNRAIQALGANASQIDLAEYIEENKTDEEERRTTLMMREAVNAICVNPKITLFPEKDDEISPLQLSALDFVYLWDWATNNPAGGEARGAASFRVK